MSPSVKDKRPSADPEWAKLALILVAVVVVLLVGYFTWWRPSHPAMVITPRTSLPRPPMSAGPGPTGQPGAPTTYSPNGAPGAPTGGTSTGP